MPTRTGWLFPGGQSFEDKRQHTLVTFPKSQKSITIEWYKDATRARVQHEEIVQGVFFYDGIRLKMTYQYKYYCFDHGGQTTEKKVPCEERESLPCEILLLGIVYQKPEIQALTAHEDKSAFSVGIYSSYMDEAGDLCDTVMRCFISYEFNLEEMKCSYNYDYHQDSCP